MRRFIYVLIGLFLLGNAFLLFSGKTYVYRALYYNFPDIDDYKIFPSRIIKKSEDPLEWPLSASYNKVKLPGSLEKLHQDLRTVAFLIIINDSIMYEEYRDGHGREKISNSFSMAKSFVSALAGIALGEGKIKSLDDKAGDYLPEMNVTGKRKIRIKDLLTMSSGLRWDEAYSTPVSLTTEAYYGTDLQKLVYGLEPEEEPGVYFNYKSGDTQLLALVLEKATGKTLSEYMEEKLWKPLGAGTEALWSLDREEGTEKAYCCINATARDFARFGQLYLRKGEWHGKQLIDGNFVEASLRPNGLKDPEGGIVDFYGYGWWLIPAYKGEDIWYCRGILGQYIIVIPSRSAVVVRLGHRRGEKAGPHYREVCEMVDAVSIMSP